MLHSILAVQDILLTVLLHRVGTELKKMYIGSFFFKPLAFIKKENFAYLIKHSYRT